MAQTYVNVYIFMYTMHTLTYTHVHAHTRMCSCALSRVLYYCSQSSFFSHKQVLHSHRAWCCLSV